MSRVDFYHLQMQPVEKVLPKLLEKAYATGKHILVKVGTEDRVPFLNTALWTYDDQSFLPHGAKADGNADRQPIWLTAGQDNPNQATMLFLVDGALADEEQLNTFERVLNLFDGQSETALQQARQFWKQVKALGCECCYWQQDENGIWKQKA
jgi:DNA polymerase-3 subunit chi